MGQNLSSFPAGAGIQVGSPPLPRGAQATSNPQAFFARVEADLRQVPFHLAELCAFVADVFPLVAPDDLPGRWAEAFLMSRRAER
jgi:hypothetical protein